MRKIFNPLGRTMQRRDFLKVAGASVAVAALPTAVRGADPVKVLLWSWVPDLQLQVDMFNAAHPGIQIELVNAGQGDPEYQAVRAGLQAGKIAPFVTELLDYATMAVGSVAAFMNPEIIVLAGRVVGGGDLVLDVLRHRLKGNVYDPPRLVIGALGHRDIVLGAVRLVLDATTLNPADGLVMAD